MPRARPAAGWGRAVLGLVFAVLAMSTGAGEACRVAFDFGSSGIRVGASNHPGTARVDIDYLAPQWAGRSLEELAAPTLAALRDLPVKAALPDDCAKVAGGFSAWRLAAGREAAGLADLLGRLQAASGVPVLVIPQAQEGAYAYYGARQKLGLRLTTSHVLDIGGGSLQVAGERSSYGALLGQKAWHRNLCQALRPGEPLPCRLQPLLPEELSRARQLADAALGEVRRALPGPVTMTAISRPVSRGVLPAVDRLRPGEITGAQLPQRSLARAIVQMAVATREESAAQSGLKSSHLPYLLSDMLLVEGLLRATDGASLTVLEAELSNLPGLLADDRAYAWGKRYACYLDRLRRQGEAAYASDPATCH